MAHATTVITAATLSTSPPRSFHRPPGPLTAINNNSSNQRRLHVSYGTITSVPPQTVFTDSPVASQDDTLPSLTPGSYGNGNSSLPYPYDDECADCFDLDIVEEGPPLINISWRWLSRLYMLVPVVSVLYVAALVAIITWGWPPSKNERKHGQIYPHPIFWQAFLIGLFASFTVQALRIPTWVTVSWLPIGAGAVVVLSTVLHTTLHEAVRLVSVPLTKPSPTSGFHSSYYLGLGWGVAETAWGIVQGWEQLELYRDVLEAKEEDESDDEEEREDMQLQQDDSEERAYRTALGPSGINSVNSNNSSSLGTVLENNDADVNEDEEQLLPDDEETYAEDEAELERRVEVLERMRARHELEEAFGIPFPNIPLPLHLLWRLDGLLLNLGLTLILSAYYYDSEPIYRHALGTVDANFGTRWEPSEPNSTPSPWLPLVWCLVTVLHVGLGLVWKVVGRAGVGAVTWGGLIVALGSVFAGLGAWGGVV